MATVKSAPQKPAPSAPPHQSDEMPDYSDLVTIDHGGEFSEEAMDALAELLINEYERTEGAA